MNPSNQPEPKQTQVNYPGNAAAHQRDIEGAKQNEPKCVYCGDPVDVSLPGCFYNSVLAVYFHDSCHKKAGIPDAQAEVGLRDKVDDFMCCRQLFSNIDRDIHREILDKLMALFQADKAAAVVEARVDENKRALVYHQSQGDIPSDRNWNMMEYYLPERIARLQPPTAGEGESV